MRSLLLDEANAIACTVIETIAPYCRQFEIVGSLRRKSPMIGDIDIACVPAAGAGENGVSMDFITAVNNLTKVKGEPSGRFTQRILPDGHLLDIFMSTPENFGTMVAFRTGSTDFYKRVIAARLAHLRMKVEHGTLYDHLENPIAAYDEDEFFRIIDLPWRAPELRAF